MYNDKSQGSSVTNSAVSLFKGFGAATLLVYMSYYFSYTDLISELIMWRNVGLLSLTLYFFAWTGQLSGRRVRTLLHELLARIFDDDPSQRNKHRLEYNDKWNSWTDKSVSETWIATTFRSVACGVTAAVGKSRVLSVATLFRCGRWLWGWPRGGGQHHQTDTPREGRRRAPGSALEWALRCPR